MTESFAVETQAPDTPYLIGPEAGSREGWEKADVTFTWSEVTDPSGVSYNLQVGTDQQMTPPIMNLTGLSSTNYKTSFIEGAYFWRVRAEDGAGNKSGWSAVSGFIVAYPIPLWAMVVLPLVFLILAGGAVYLIRMRKATTKAGA